MKVSKRTPWRRKWQLRAAEVGGMRMAGLEFKVIGEKLKITENYAKAMYDLYRGAKRWPELYEETSTYNAMVTLKQLKEKARAVMLNFPV